jgi:hypothetical protein
LAEKIHFKIKNADVEIEYEGPLAEANKRYDKAFDWVSTIKPTNGNGKEKQNNGNTQIDTDNNKKDNRGGARKAIYPKYIQKAKDEGFFKTKRSLIEVEAKFRDLGAPVTGKRTQIHNALMNDTKKDGSKLHATKENEVWSYWED